MRSLLIPAFLLLAACSDSSGPAAPAAVEAPDKVGHVFIIVLENMNYADTFGAGAASGAPYLTSDLPARGALLTQYHATGHVSLDNYISMVSGQSPNPATSGDCLFFLDWLGTTAPDADGQVTGIGCVYPPAVRTVANQLQEAGYSWKGYMEDMGNDLARDGSATCAHPPLNAQDPTQSASASDQYATRHNPFVYFHSIIDDQANCDARVRPLTDLPADLALAAATPHYVFITPNLCNDGHDTGCANGDPGGQASIDTFLREWVPQILESAAFQQDGLLIVTFDEALPSDGAACCNEPTGPNTPFPGIVGPGGGRIGAVLISPLIRPGTVSDVPYNHYAMLRSIEDMFGLPYLGYAGQMGLVTFGPDVFTAR
ncbi:MAG TPA: alkaline phosphatase family protein [Solimonas sp.]|nr:alkaline phosphatase family protein [Solimonas sp.]